MPKFVLILRLSLQGGEIYIGPFLSRAEATSYRHRVTIKHVTHDIQQLVTPREEEKGN